MYDSRGIDPRDHFIVYSDNINVDLAKRIKAQCDDLGMKCFVALPGLVCWSLTLRYFFY